MAHVVSYLVFSVILGIFSLYNAENFDDSQKTKPFYTSDQSAPRDYGSSSQDGSEENALPAYYRNNFDCSVHRYSYGMYADLDFDCQVYHVCHNNRKETFMCPKGTLFNQQILSCDHWYSVRCRDTPNFYHVNELLGKSSNGTYGGQGGPYSTRRFPADNRPYGQQGYGNQYSRDQLTPFSDRDNFNTTGYGTNQVQSGEKDPHRPSTGYIPGSQAGGRGQYGNQQTGTQFNEPLSSSGQNSLTGAQASVWDRKQPQPGSSTDGRLPPTGSQSSLFDRRYPQPGFQGSSFDRQKPQSGIKGPYSDRTRPQPGSYKPDRPETERYPYGRGFSQTGSQGSSFGGSQPGADRFSSGRQSPQSGYRGSSFDSAELGPGSSFDKRQPGAGSGLPGSSSDRRQPGSGLPGSSFDGRQPGSGSSFDRRQPGSGLPGSSFDRRQPGSQSGSSFDGRQPGSQSGSSFDGRQPGSGSSFNGRQPGRSSYGRQSPQSGFVQKPFGSPESGSPGSSFERPQPGAERYPFGRQPSRTPLSGSTFDRPQSGLDRYPSGRQTPQTGSRGSIFDKIETPDSDTTQPGSGRYPYGRQSPDRGSQGSLYGRTQPGSDSFGREQPQTGFQRKPYERPGSQRSPFDSGRGFRLTTRRPSTISGEYDVQKPIGFRGLSGISNTTNQFSTYPTGSGLPNYNRPYTGSHDTRFNQPSRGSEGSRYNNLQSPSNFRQTPESSSRPGTQWRPNDFSSQTSSEWSPNAPRNNLQTPYRPPSRVINTNYTSAFGSHQKSSETKDRSSMLGQSSQLGESNLPTTDKEGLKPILVYQNHVPVALTQNNSTGATLDTSKDAVTNENLPAYKIYYVKEDQLKN